MAEPTQPKTTEEELEEAFEAPAPFCNKTYLMLTPITGRLVFAEIRTNQSKPHVRAAVSMSIGDLVELRKLLDRHLEGKVQVTGQKDPPDA